MNTQKSKGSDLIIDWERFPKLREIFEHRPIVNVYWRELMLLASELVAKGYAPR
jgi:hypothetical protein